MFTLQDGREHFYQWDINRQIIVSDPTVTEVHFCNKTDTCSLVVEVEQTEVYADNQLSVVHCVANVPNILLQSDFPIRVYAYCNDGYTKVEKVFKVHSRTKPSDYAYTETEIKSYEYLDKKLTEIEQKGFSEETVNNAVTEWMYQNPLAVYDDGEGNVFIEAIPNGQEVKW